jgi:predicted CXXCH cytochrome family protein
MAANRLVVWSLELVAVFAAVALGAASVGSIFVNGEPHNFSTNECYSCHFTLPEPGSTEPMSFMDDITTMCTRCHEVSSLSHVVDVEPQIPIPDGMPLSAQGTITCVTCHDPHCAPTNPKTGEKTYFLRLAGPGKQFCLLCHEDKNQPGEVTIFSPSGGVTHRRSMTLSHGLASFKVVDPLTDLDPLSVMCIRCHDNKEDEADKSKLGMGIWDHGEGIGRSHPIGMNYGDAAWNNNELVPERDLDRRIVLFDDKVGCCSCHNMYAMGGGPGLVIGDMDNYQDLCFGCHIK